jgi:organic radical activating enzyme
LKYALSDGRILTWSLETHLVDHCNLRCGDCCTLSPSLSPWQVDPEDLARDLALAGRALRPNLFKLTGGEPLLHPRLLRCLEAVRDSGICDAVSLTTNGILLAAQPDALFEALDRITLSRYSSAPLPEKSLRVIAERCAQFDVRLTVKQIDRFQILDAPADRSPAETRATFEACWLRERCHLLYRGHFYTCTRPPHLAQRDRGEQAFAHPDGIELEGPRLRERLAGYLEADEPLAACSSCLGAGGGWRDHRQEPRASIAAP